MTLAAPTREGGGAGVHLAFPNAPRRINAASFDYIAFSKVNVLPDWR